MEPRCFATPAEWRRWLARHHRRAPEFWVRFQRKAAGRPSISWPEAVDQALCHGWNDGIRKRLDDHSYVIRFTPRGAGSIWSAVNLRRVAELTAEGRMEPAGVSSESAFRSGTYWH